MLRAKGNVRALPAEAENEGLLFREGQALRETAAELASANALQLSSFMLNDSGVIDLPGNDLPPSRKRHHHSECDAASA